MIDEKLFLFLYEDDSHETSQWKLYRDKLF